MESYAMKRPLLVVGGLAFLAAVTLVYSAGLVGSDTPQDKANAIKDASDPKDPQVVIDTSMGKITVELFEKKSPKTVKNFLAYVDSKHYDGTIFHRVIKEFMIQGGGFSKDLKEKPTRAPVENEAGNGLSNSRGTIAMARTNDPDSATAQFYINTGKDEQGNPGLDWNTAQHSAGYTVFGKVIDGMDVVNQIQEVKTTRKKGMDDVPVETVTIKSIRRVKK